MRPPLLWLTLVAVLALTSGLLLTQGQARIQTSLLALVPDATPDALQQAAQDRLASVGQRQLIFLLQAENAADRQAAAAALQQSLQASPAIRSAVTRYSDLPQPDAEDKDLLRRNRFALLAPADRRALSRGEIDSFMQRARARLYGLSTGSDERFIDDPFGLSDAYRRGLSATAGVPGLALDNAGRLTAVDEKDQRWSVVLAELSADPFDFDAQPAQNRAIEDGLRAAQQAGPRVQAVTAGMQRHAAHATRQARSEISLIGSGSIAGILLLMLWAFGSPRPFLLSLAALGGGVLFAFTVTLLIFGELHVLTLVFGASIVGVAIDYCFHFFCQRWQTPSAYGALAIVRPAIRLGLLTSLLAYASMALTPFPALRQMGSFAACGLLGAWVGVVLLLPATAGPPPRARRPLAAARGWLRVTGRLGNTALGRGLLLLLLPALILAIWLTTPNDDIGLLNSSPPRLLEAERQTRDLLGTGTGGRALLIAADNQTELLKAETDALNALELAMPPPAISRVYPTPARQRADYTLLAGTLYAPDGPAAALLQSLGFPEAAVAEHMQTFRSAADQTLPLESFLTSTWGRGLRDLWLQADGRYATLLRLPPDVPDTRVKSVLAAQPDARLIDRRADISASLARYRHRAGWLLALAYGLAGLLLWRLFDAASAALILAAPLLASAFTLIVLSLTAAVFSLFNVMALVLLLGLGVDYGIFLRMAGQQAAPAMTAVALSALTTLLAFGLLAFSATPALHGFGLTLVLGLGFTFVFASLLARRPGLNA